jgi:hypothetical protein
VPQADRDRIFSRTALSILNNLAVARTGEITR